MTKHIRVENADTSDWKVVVEVWDRSTDGTPDRLAESHPLNHPTAMVKPYITSTRYLVVRELPAAS